MEAVVPTTPDTDSPDSWTTPRARLAGYKRRGRPDSDPDVVAARRQLRTAKFEADIKALVDDAPPLSALQRNELALLLLGGGDHAPAA
jgi:hypothetical protein